MPKDHQHRHTATVPIRLATFGAIMAAGLAATGCTQSAAEFAVENPSPSTAAVAQSAGNLVQGTLVAAGEREDQAAERRRRTNGSRFLRDIENCYAPRRRLSPATDAVDRALATVAGTYASPGGDGGGDGGGEGSC